MEKIPNIEPRPLNRWITVLSGIVLLPFSILCIISSGFILIAPDASPNLFTVSIGSLLLLGSIWVFYLSIRLLLVDPKSHKKFINPSGLKISALIFILIPVVSLLTGTFWEKPILHGMMVFIYFGIAMQLFNIAKHREK